MVRWTAKWRSNRSLETDSLPQKCAAEARFGRKSVHDALGDDMLLRKTRRRMSLDGIFDYDTNGTRFAQKAS